MTDPNQEVEKENSERWLLTYSDMITLLLALFIVLYSMSNLDAGKYSTMAEELGRVLGGGMPFTGTAYIERNGMFATSNTSDKTKSNDEGLGKNGQQNQAGTGQNGNSQTPSDKFDQTYNELKEKVGQSGVDLEKTESSINMRFKDSVLFYGDSSRMKPAALPVLQKLGSTLQSIKPIIDHIEVDGHTADVFIKDDNYFSWQLSADRAIAVLKYLSESCNLPVEKMSIGGFSHYVPIKSNNTEEGRSANRRVEIKITRIQENTSN
ncbi:MAG: flagellar motor protein MotB [Bacillota bacterium]|nr:flagellar motor protein MotB [Bacillota bacterium]